MRLRFVYAGFTRHAEDHPELLEHVPCDEYFGPPSLGIASLAAVTPPEWELDFRDDRLEDVGLDDELDLVAISCFTPSGKRALELARAFRARGTKVVMGGIFPTTVPSEAGQAADAIVLGEGESVWSSVLADAARGELAPIYHPRWIDPAELPLPRVDLYFEKEGQKFRPDDYPVQVQRGCPMTCSACAIPATMGKTIRAHTQDHVIGQIEQLEAHGKLASFTEDTSFFPGGGAQRRFRELLRALVARGREAPVSYVGISMPLVLTTRSELLTELRAAGVRMFYLVGGFDPITRGAFTGRDPKILARAYDTIAKCHDHDIEPYTSFLVGNDDDDEGVFDRMLEFADRAKIAKAEFAIRTPYPGTPSFEELSTAGRLLHRDWSRYNDANVVFQPAKMSPERLLEGYLELWKGFYRSRQALSKLDHRVSTIQF
jgi:radical SAM superfamily enzyme YgiQ (UPF0313 family)